MSLAPVEPLRCRLAPEAAAACVERLYARHARTVYGLSRLLLRDEHESEDATQATFLAAHAALVRGNVPRDEQAWLVAIARNECRARIRARMRTPASAPETALDGLPAPDPAPEEAVADPSVRRALHALPERQREAVVLHDVLGLRSREVAAALGLSLPAVEALLVRARRQLRLRLRPVGGALAVPLGVREALAELLPGFAPAGTAAFAGTAGAAGAGGLLAKIVGAPAAAKVATAALAVGTAGSVAAVEDERGAAPLRTGAVAAAVVSTAVETDDRSGRSAADRSGEDRRRGGDGSDGSGRRGDDGDRSGRSGGGEERSGRSGADAEHERSRSASSPHEERSDRGGGAGDDSSGPGSGGPARGGERSGPGGGGDDRSGSGSGDEADVEDRSGRGDGSAAQEDD